VSFGCRGSAWPAPEPDQIESYEGRKVTA